jgi:glyine---[glycyl-carrier protein] ligase
MPLPEIIDLPLSAAQRELWLAQEFGTESQGNNVAELFSIEGKLDEDLFRRALEHTFREVESLQVQFLRRNGAILQQFDPSSVLNYAVIDLRSESSTRLAMLEWISEDLHQHVDLTVGKLHATATGRH